MTSSAAAPVPAAGQGARRWPLVDVTGVAFGVGVLTGASTWGAEQLVGAYGNLGILLHTVAPWGMVTVVAGLVLRPDWRRAAWAGVVLQLGLVVSYYVTHGLAFDHLDVDIDESYQLLACVAGPVYGAAGALLGSPRAALRRCCIALVAAAWFVDAGRRLPALTDDRVLPREAQSYAAAAVTLVVLGVVASLLVSRSVRDWVVGLLLSLPVVVLGHVVLVVL